MLMLLLLLLLQATVMRMLPYLTWMHGTARHNRMRSACTPKTRLRLSVAVAATIGYRSHRTGAARERAKAKLYRPSRAERPAGGLQFEAGQFQARQYTARRTATDTPASSSTPTHTRGMSRAAELDRQMCAEWPTVQSDITAPLPAAVPLSTLLTCPSQCELQDHSRHHIPSAANGCVISTRRPRPLGRLGSVWVVECG